VQGWEGTHGAAHEQALHERQAAPLHVRQQPLLVAVRERVRVGEGVLVCLLVEDEHEGQHVAVKNRATEPTTVSEVSGGRSRGLHACSWQAGACPVSGELSTRLHAWGPVETTRAERAAGPSVKRRWTAKERTRCWLWASGSRSSFWPGCAPTWGARRSTPAGSCPRGTGCGSC
jgi:hypothetical protein